ncbi:MAG: zinc ribbon domain-containing protein [Rivularia sp. ALOHA_DT_140]|nr:zinc ribbon domain-containing protein [Rivularia sp. ALOHA_DT_140]
MAIAVFSSKFTKSRCSREGFALLQGLVICGKCGRKMSPRYHGNGGCRAAYECTQARKQDGNMGGKLECRRSRN